MIEPSSSRALDLGLAIPVGAFVGAVALTLVVGADEPLPTFVRELRSAPVTALAVAVYLLPFAIIIGVPGYFALRRANQLGVMQGGALGALVGLAYAVATAAGNASWLAICAVTGLASGASAGTVLLLFARRRASRAPSRLDAEAWSHGHEQR